MKKLLALFLIVLTASFVQADELLSAASSFTLKGISSMKMEILPKPNGKQILALDAQVIFDNFSEQTLGKDKARDIRLSDLQIKVMLVDSAEAPKKTKKVDDDGNIVYGMERTKVCIGQGVIEDLVIPVEGMTEEMTIAIVRDLSSESGQGGETTMASADFERLLLFSNLFVGTQKERERFHLVFEGTCKVAMLGENDAWVWDPTPRPFTWELKSTNKSDLVLESVRTRQ